MDCICDYINKPYTDYAVMLNGEWGSGKTYFWNNKLRDRLESLTNSEGKKYKTIYMSLYGINSLEEISKKIFIETNPNMSKALKKIADSNKQGNVVPEYVKTGLDMANLFGSLNIGNEKIDYSKLFSTKDKILCFDDLERANVDVIDILGYINNFVEHDGIKTIVICNEKELATKFRNSNLEFKTLIATYILDKEKKINTKGEDKPLANMIDDKIAEIFDKVNAYERIKEKLIGETFEYIPEYSYILSGMIMKYEYNQGLADFLKRNTSVIIAAFNKSETRNLRILKHSLADFERIYTAIMKDYPNTPSKILKTILTFTIAVSFEIKAGNVSKEKLSSIKSNDEYISTIFTSSLVNDNSQFYLKEFDNRYFFGNDSKYKFFKFVEVYVRTRYFDMRLYKDNMQEANQRVDEDKVKSANKYNLILSGDYLKMSDFDFNVLVRQVLDEIRAGKPKFVEYINLFSVYKYLIDMGLYSDITISELKNAVTTGMQIAASEIKVIEGDEYELKVETLDDDVKEMVGAYNRVKRELTENLALSKATDLFKNLPGNIPQFYTDIMGKYAMLPVFSKYDMKDLYAKLEVTQNYDLYNFINLFNVRYKGKKELFDADKKNLQKLVEIIRKNEYVKTEKTINSVLLTKIADTIENIDCE